MHWPALDASAQAQLLALQHDHLARLLQLGVQAVLWGGGQGEGWQGGGRSGRRTGATSWQCSPAALSEVGPSSVLEQLWSSLRLWPADHASPPLPPTPTHSPCTARTFQTPCAATWREEAAAPWCSSPRRCC